MGLGMSSIVTKFVAEDIAKGEKEEAASVYYNALLLSELASVLIAGAFLVSKFPAGVSHLPYSPAILLIGILFAIDVAASIGPTAAAAFYGLLEFRDYAVIYATIYGVLRPWLVVLLIYLVKSLVGLVGAWIISDSVLAVYVFLYLWRKLGPPVFRFDRKYLLKLSCPLYLATLASFMYGTFDQLTLIPLVPLTALGVYGATVTAYSAYYGLVAVLGTVLLPVFSGVHGAKGPEVLENSVRTASRYVSLVAMPMAFALLATARPALTLLVGRSYEGGALPLAVLALASTASIVALSLSPILIVLNETLLAALTAILPLPFSVAVALISIPTLGILGAAIARGLSMVLGLLLTSYFVRRKISADLDYQAIIKSVAASGTMALTMEAVQLLYYSRFLLPLYLVVGALVYLLAMRALRAMNTADIELLRHTLGPRSGRISDLLSRLVVR
jgi:O-antigen/teichoic acid export membrane protein